MIDPAGGLHLGNQMPDYCCGPAMTSQEGPHLVEPFVGPMLNPKVDYTLGKSNSGSNVGGTLGGSPMGDPCRNPLRVPNWGIVCGLHWKNPFWTLLVGTI
jgi:hypothetical protein